MLELFPVVWWACWPWVRQSGRWPGRAAWDSVSPSFPIRDEIRSRVHGFSREWADATSEQGEAQTFWNELFHVYGLRRKHVALFEKHVARLGWGGGRGRIDLFWPGKVIAEHKSRGESLAEARTQGFGYAVAMGLLSPVWPVAAPSRMPRA